MTRKTSLYRRPAALFLTGCLILSFPSCTPLNVDPRQEQEEEEEEIPEEERDWTDIAFRTPDSHNIDMYYLGNREYKLVAGGSDPYIFSARLFSEIPASRNILSFVYKSTYDIKPLQIFFVVNGQASEESSQKYGNLKASDDYQSFKVDISSFLEAGWGKVGDGIRFDPGSSGDGTVFIRNLRIRSLTEEERKAEQEEIDRIASYAYELVAKTVKAEPDIEGAVVSWSNEYNVNFTVNVSFKDVTGTTRTLSKTSNIDDRFSIGAFTEPTDISVTVSNHLGDVSAASKFRITPNTGEIPTTRMTFPRYSSIWSENVGFDKVIDRDTDTYWHSEPFNDGKGPYQWFVVDLGSPHKVNAIEAIRRKSDAGYGSPIQKIQVSASLKDEDDSYVAVVPKKDYHPETVYAGHLFTFDKEAVARYLKVEFWTSGDWTHLAEFLAYYSPDPANDSPYAKRED